MLKNPEILEFFDIPNEHFPNHSAQWLLRDNENVRALVDLVFPESSEQMDFSGMVRLESGFILDNLREQVADIVIRVPYRDQSENDGLLIYILIEHQSTVDLTMPFRLLLYMTQIWDAQRREWESNRVPRSEWRFRAVIPIVFYTGDRPWNASLSLGAMMGIPDELSKFVPKFEILFLGLMDTDDADLTKTNHPLGWLLTVLKKATAPKETLRSAIIEAISSMNALDDELALQRRQAIGYFLLLIFHRRPADEHEELRAIVNQHIQHSTDKQEVEQMEQTMAEQLFERGIEQGMERGDAQGFERGDAHGFERGIEQGAVQANQAALLRLLESRFNPVPETVVNRITLTRNLSRLDSLFEKALNAETLEEIDLEINDS